MSISSLLNFLRPKDSSFKEKAKTVGKFLLLTFGAIAITAGWLLNIAVKVGGRMLEQLLQPRASKRKKRKSAS